MAENTAGIFIENEKKINKAADRIETAIKSLRLVTFEMDGLTDGQHKISVSSTSGGRLHAQRAIVEH